VDLFTPTFAASRVVGWTAHILEQVANNRLIRPEAEYTGPTDLHFVPLSKRGNWQDVNGTRDTPPVLPDLK